VAVAEKGGRWVHTQDIAPKKQRGVWMALPLATYNIPERAMMGVLTLATLRA
jgi:hypothetical protein